MQTYLVEIEDKVELTDIAEVVIQNFHEKVYAFQVCQLIICRVYAEAEEEASISPVHHFVAFELPNIKESG